MLRPAGQRRITDRRLLRVSGPLADKRAAVAAAARRAAVTERFPGWNDTAAAYAEAFGTARWLLDEVAGIAERPGGEDR